MLLSRMQTPVAPRPILLSVAELHKETSEALRIVLTTPSSFSYKSGQFLTLLTTISNTEYRRCYSLCSSPYTKEPPSIVVKRIKNGVVSNYLFDTLSVGQKLITLPPMGSFTTAYDNSRSLCYFFIAAGSGITPLFSLIQSVLLREPFSKVHLLYVNRSPSEIILAKGLQSLQYRYPKQLHLLHLLKEKAEELPDSRQGRLDPTLLNEILSLYGTPEQYRYFLCTPPSLQSILCSYLKERGTTEQHIRQESFTADESLPVGVLTPPQAQQVTLRIGDRDHKVEVKSGQTLLTAAVEEGLDVPYSCQKGVCTTCRAKLLQGSIQYARSPQGLSEEEKKSNYILCCLAQPTSSDVIVEVE